MRAFQKFLPFKIKMDCKRTWIQCGRNACGKWRVVRDDIAAKYADIPWTCDMNEDRHYNKCSVPEEKVDVPRGKKVVVTKLPYEKGEIIMAKMAGYCLWPAIITPDPNCDEYYDAVLNDNDEQEEFTHIHVEFFGRPRTHAWVQVKNAFPYTGCEKTSIKSKWKRSYNIAREDAVSSIPLTCEERLRRCAFRSLRTGDIKQGTQSCLKENMSRDMNKEEGTRFSHEFHHFTALNGVKVDQIKSPVWCGTTIDLHEIFQTVKSHGGFTEICRKNMWLTLWKGLTRNVHLQSKPSGNILKKFYERHLLDFELYLKMKEGQESQLLPNSQHQDGHQCNSNLPKKRGRPRKPLGMKSNNSHGSTSCSRNLGGHDFETDPKRISPQQIFNEEVVSSRESRKRKRETIETSRSILATAISTTSYSNPGIINSKESNEAEVVEELNLVSFQPMLKKIPQEKKSRKRKPKRFISPFLATTISDSNASVQEEQICQSTTGSNKIIVENELFIEEQHSMPAAEADKSQTTVHSPLPGGTNLTFYEPHDFASVGEQSCKSSSKILGNEYVPSSNPNSPQIFPTEEDLEEDCEISIRRELEEMERVLQGDDSVDLKGFHVIKNKSNLTAPVEDLVLLTDDVVMDAINEMLMLEEDISRLEDSADLDSV